MGKRERCSGTRHSKQFWVEEGESFGAKYMQRFGWKPGDAIGADGNTGLKKCIGIVKKNDQMGIGGKHTNVVKHQAIVSMFNDILKKAGKPRKKKSKKDPLLNVDQYIAKSALYRRFVRAKNQEFDYLKDREKVVITEAPKPTKKKSKKKKKTKIKIDSEFRKQMAEKFNAAGKFGMGSSDTITFDEQEAFATSMNERAQTRKKKGGLGFGKPAANIIKKQADTIDITSTKKDKKKKKKKKRKRGAEETEKRAKKKRKTEEKKDEEEEKDNVEIESPKKKKRKKKKILTEIPAVEGKKKRKKSKKQKLKNVTNEAGVLEIPETPSCSPHKRKKGKKKKKRKKHAAVATSA